MVFAQVAAASPGPDIAGVNAPTASHCAEAAVHIAVTPSRARAVRWPQRCSYGTSNPRDTAQAAREMISEAASAALTDPSQWNEGLQVNHDRCLHCVRCVQGAPPRIVAAAPTRICFVSCANVAVAVRSDSRGRGARRSPPPRPMSERSAAGWDSLGDRASRHSRCPALRPTLHRARKCGRSAGPRDFAQPGARAAAKIPLPMARWPPAPAYRRAEASPQRSRDACQPPRLAGTTASETFDRCCVRIS